MSNTQLDPSLFREETQNDFNLKEILYKYLSYWKWFILSFTLAFFSAFIYLRYQTPQYRIQGSILIKDERKGMGGDQILKELDIFSSNKVVDNEIEILKSYTLIEKVVSDLKLNINYYAVKRIKDAELYNNSPIVLDILEANDSIYKNPLKLTLIDDQKAELNDQTIPLDQPVVTPYGTLKLILTGKSDILTELIVKVNPPINVVENLKERLKAESSSKMSSVLMLSIEDAVKQRGEDIINSLIDAYNEASLKDKNKEASNTLTFIEERLKLLTGDLTIVEKNVEEYKAKEGITNISEVSKIFLENVQQNDIHLNQVKIQQSILNGIEEFINNKNNQNALPATLGINDPVLLNLINQLSDFEIRREQAIKLIKSDNPIVIALDDQIKGIKNKIHENVQNLKKNLSLTNQQLEAQNKELELVIRAIPGKERALVDITRQQTIKNNLYVFLLEKREETALSCASAVSDSRTIDMARSSIRPVKPVKIVVYLVFSILGLVTPLGFIYIVDLLNDKIKSVNDIEKITKTPIIGKISYNEDAEAIIVNKMGRSVMAEQMRTLRTNLSFLTPGKNVQNILFTSSMSGEGKSFISLNLGASLAITGKKTVILELDMRKPRLHAALNMKSSTGISNYLIGKAELKDIIQPVPEHDNYFILTCGPIPPNPAELLLNSKLGEMFTELRKLYDYIIIDAPPVGIVTDAQILENHADITIYVLRHDFTPKDQLRNIDMLYREKKFKHMNLIFNAIKESGRYGYGYGYGYGYYQDEESKEGQKKRIWNNILKRNR